MSTKLDLRALQIGQQEHDLHCHLDILSLHKMERMKHYALHFSKYVGRLARGDLEQKPLDATLVDALLVALSAANALNQRLHTEDFHIDIRDDSTLEDLADAAGRFADACEKMDHLESFRDLALQANHDVIQWVLRRAAEKKFDLGTSLLTRRKFLATRQAYHSGGDNVLERRKA